jgi:hypothetical protein
MGNVTFREIILCLIDILYIFKHHDWGEAFIITHNTTKHYVGKKHATAIVKAA